MVCELWLVKGKSSDMSVVFLDSRVRNKVLYLVLLWYWRLVFVFNNSDIKDIWLVVVV